MPCSARTSATASTTAGWSSATRTEVTASPFAHPRKRGYDCRMSSNGTSGNTCGANWSAAFLTINCPTREGIIEPVQHDTEETRTLVTLGRLTRGALHELSNPLVALLGSAELALNDVEPGTKLHDRIALTHRTGASGRDRACAAGVHPAPVASARGALGRPGGRRRGRAGHAGDARPTTSSCARAETRPPSRGRARSGADSSSCSWRRSPSSSTRGRSNWSSRTASSPRRAAASCGSSARRGGAPRAGRRAARQRPRRPPARRRSRPRPAFPARRSQPVGTRTR